MRGLDRHRPDARAGGVRADEHPRFRRVNAPVLCRLTGLSIGARGTGGSQAGLRFFSDQEFLVDQCVDIELLLPDRTAFLGLARVAWIQEAKQPGGPRFDIGIEILHPRGQSLKRLAPVLG